MQLHKCATQVKPNSSTKAGKTKTFLFPINYNNFKRKNKGFHSTNCCQLSSISCHLLLSPNQYWYCRQCSACGFRRECPYRSQ